MNEDIFNPKGYQMPSHLLKGMLQNKKTNIECSLHHVIGNVLTGLLQCTNVYDSRAKCVGTVACKALSYSAYSYIVLLKLTYSYWHLQAKIIN